MPKRLTSTYHNPDGSVDVLEKDRCPICGHQFDEVQDLNVCPKEHPVPPLWPEELITEVDDYEWYLLM